MSALPVPTSNRHRDLLVRLERQAEELCSSKGWQAWIKFASRFRSYSLRNQLLIQMQRPNATRVAGYRAWQALGRHVVSGERGIAIFAPRTRKVEDDNGERVRVVSGFHVVHVFDVAQTFGDPLPELVLPAVGGGNDAVFAALVETIRSEELDLRYQSEDVAWSGPNGWISHHERTVTLVDHGQGVSGMSRTLLHELAHWADPAAGHAAAVDLEPVLEVVAETAAMIVGTSLLGLEMIDASALYVSSWKRGLEGFDGGFMSELAEHSLRVASRLEAMVKPHLDAAAVDPQAI